jgi:hypothetical protein
MVLLTISYLITFIHFYENFLEFYNIIGRLSFHFYKFKIATLDLVMYCVFKFILTTTYYMREFHSKINFF